MLQAFVITLREGLEAFLIIGISLAYLRKSNRQELISAVHWGIGLSVLLSIGAAYLFQQASNQALWEGVLAIAAAVSVATLTVHMWRTAKKIKSEIEGHLRTSAEKTGNAAWMGVFLFTLLMISREGMETALLMGTLLTQVQAMTIVGGAIAGTLASAAIAMLWSRYGHRVNLALFFAWHVLWPAGSGGRFDAVAAAIGVLAAVLLFRYKVGVLPVLGVSALLGLAWRMLG